MVVVKRRKGESKDSVFRKFTRSFIEENILDDVRKKQFYKKPSLVRQEEEKERRKMRHKRHSIIRTGYYRRKIH
ncbi:30S ribosomal protein S21 [Patescibacteria group bacterium]|nr:30S ribosomal protein S21 [Patescibacteria group bacterium]MCL5091826.1 30S ribosomal protein S21 [Patescibacteria group bacterium]